MLKLEPSPKARVYGLSEEYHFTQAEWLKMVSVAKERGTLSKFCAWQKSKFIVIQSTADERREVIKIESKKAESQEADNQSSQG